jgi:hypothetical protein
MSADARQLIDSDYKPLTRNIKNYYLRRVDVNTQWSGNHDS